MAVSHDTWSQHPKCSERKVEWMNMRQKLVQPHPLKDYEIPDSIDPKNLDKDFDQLRDDLGEFSLGDELGDFSPERVSISKAFGLDPVILSQRIQDAETKECERLSLEQDVAGFVNHLTHAFVSPNQDKAAKHFTICMEEFRRVAKALPKSEYARSLIKKALNMLADKMDFLTTEVRKHCIRQTYRHAEKDRVITTCSTEEQKNQVQAIQDLMAFEEYQLDINHIVAEVADPSQPGDSSDEGEGEEALSSSDRAPMRPEEEAKKSKEESEKKAKDDEEYRKAMASIGEIERSKQEFEERKKQSELDSLDQWQKLLTKKLEEENLKQRKSFPAPGNTATTLSPSLDNIKERDEQEQHKDSSLPPTSETLRPAPLMLVKPVKTKEMTKTKTKFKIIEQRKQEVADAQGDQEKMAAATKKMVLMADAANAKVVEKTRDIAKKPLSKDKVISKTGHLVDVRAIQDEVVPPGTRPPEVMAINNEKPGKPANIHCTLVELLEQPVMRRFDSPADVSPEEARSWSLTQLKAAFENKAGRFSDTQRECIRKHLRTLQSFLGNKSYPFSYFKDMATPVKLPEEPFGLIAQSLYDEWIGFPMVSYADYTKIHAFDNSTRSRFLVEIFSEATMKVLESLFPDKAGMKGKVRSQDLCPKPEDAFDVGCVTHTSGIRIAMLYSPSKRSHYLAVREHGKESVIPCKGKNTSEYLGGRRSPNIAYQNIGVPMISDSGTSALAVPRWTSLPYKPTF
ncbi:hypothetical protein [Endozoicomonas arenosclerae]|uniref:hypothetical protein n=1 Tax=Endozoicomonas arenosclerae TaxID=1633495 RepID=UPI000782CE23|nr:hypothetical protein [Endozoicomonas arenosclerae]